MRVSAIGNRISVSSGFLSENYFPEALLSLLNSLMLEISTHSRICSSTMRPISASSRMLLSWLSRRRKMQYAIGIRIRNLAPNAVPTFRATPRHYLKHFFSRFGHSPVRSHLSCPFGTFLPSAKRSLVPHTGRFARSEHFCCHFDHPVGKAPLVVVPREHFCGSSDCDGGKPVHNRACLCVHNVLRQYWVFRILEYALHPA